MSFSEIGMNAKVKSTVVRVVVNTSHPFIRLVNALDWPGIMEVARPDLEKTKKGLFWRGRKIFLRIHLAVMILQCLLKETDRGIEQRIKDTPVLQIFCGLRLILKWFCPDHTRIEKFRNRLSAETHRRIGLLVLKTARSVGFADPSWLDLDSTVQEANMSYPSDAQLMRKLAQQAYKILKFLKEKKKRYLPDGIQIDIKEISKKAQEYFFLAKNTCIEKKRKIFKEYHQMVKRELKPVILLCEKMAPQALKALPWNILDSVNLMKDHGWKYLLDVGHFVRAHSIKPGKRLAFHCIAVACIRKGKVGKEYEFGRVFQLGRIGGNFVIPFPSTNIRMEDKESLIPAIKEHQRIFGIDVLESIGTDKGYYSAKNVQSAKEMKIATEGIQRPVTVKDQPPKELSIELRDRRAGVEPLIGHVKLFGLKKSKMKSDEATLASGYRSVLGFNLHQFMRHQQGLVEKTG